MALGDVVLYAFSALLLCQIPLGVVVYVDARRRDLEQANRYRLAIHIIPVMGILAFLHYVSERDSLSATSEEHSSDDTL
jgi:hypothetical protein